MKGKFSSMWRVAIAMVMVLSLSLVMAVPAAAAPLTSVTATPDDDVAGATPTYTIVFTTATLLEVAATADQILITFPAGFDVSGATVDEATVTQSTTDPTLEGVVGQLITLDVAADEAIGVQSIVLTGIDNTEIAATDYVVTVETQDGLDANIDGPTDSDEFAIVHGDLAAYTVTPAVLTQEVGIPFNVDIQAVDAYENPMEGDYTPAEPYIWETNASDAADGTEPNINAPLETGDFGTDTATKEVTLVYAEAGVTFAVEDDNGITGLSPEVFVEGISLDSAFYKIGDDVAITVCDESANLDTIRTDTIDVTAKSDHDTVGITVTLSETGGVNSGVFTSTFPLVAIDPEPGPDELAVEEGDTVTVAYGPLPSATAVIDETAPEFDAVDPVVADALYYKNGDTVTLTVELDAVGYTVTADFSEIDSEYVAGAEGVTDDGGGTYTVAYAIDADNTIADETYAITVTAKDGAGNSVTDDSCSVSLDNTVPSVTDPATDPQVIQPATATDVTFTATVVDDGSGIDTVTVDLSDPAIGGSATQAMYDDETNGDETAADGIYTYLLSDLNVATEDEGTYELGITATDNVDNANTAEKITLRVIADVTAPVIESTEVEYPVGFESAREGDNVIITAVVTDDLAGVDTVTIDATDIGLGAAVAMTPGDDDTYSATLTVGAVDPDTYTLTITATDYAGNPSDDVEVTVEVTLGLTAYNIGLYAGWNLISLPLIPDDSSIDVVLSGVSEISSVYYWYNDGTSTGWQSYVPGSGGTLTAMEDGKAYFIYMTGADTLTITGTAMPAPPATPPIYDVYAGWNFIGFKSLENMANELYLNTLTTGGEKDYSILYGYDNTTGYFRVFPNPQTHGGADLGDMEVGYGYWLWLNTSNGIITP